MKANNLLLKTFSVSLFIHIAGISLFSLVLPSPRPNRGPIEVALLPSSTKSGNVVLAGNALTRPRALTGRERIATALKRNARASAGSGHVPARSGHVPVTHGYLKPDIPEFQEKLPDIIAFKSLEVNLGKNPAAEAGESVENNGLAQGEHGTGVDSTQTKSLVDSNRKNASKDILEASIFPELDAYPEQASQASTKWLLEPKKTGKKLRSIIRF